MQLRKNVQDAILRKVQQSDSETDFGPLEKIYRKDVVDFYLKDLIDVQLIDGKIIKGISPPSTNFVVWGLTAAGHRRLGIDETGAGLAAD